MLVPGLRAETPAPDAAVLTALLKEFLAGASRNDVAIHDRFWGEDLIYTGSAGRRIGKPDIMGELRSPPPSTTPAAETATYSAEDVRIHQYGNTAVVAFRLVGTTPSRVTNYLNTGLFLKRQGRWQAVGWQATRMPRTEDEAKSAINDVERLVGAWIDAWLKKDGAAVDTMMTPEYTYVAPNGQVFDRAAILAIIRAPSYRLDGGRQTEVKITRLGEGTAVLIDRWHGSGSYEGKPFTDDHRCTRVCVQQGTRWLVAQEQYSAVVP
jgi:ketosteroid isomerase-like protein